MSRNRPRTLGFLLAALCFAPAPVIAQIPPEVRIRSAAWFPPNLTISADANLVELAATVHDKQEHLIGGLRAADFELLEDSQPREITFFAEIRAGGAVSNSGNVGPSGSKAESAPSEPRTIALFFDDVHASVLLRKSAEAAAKLIARELRPGDRVGIFTSSAATSVDFTSDRSRLLGALATLHSRTANGVTPETPPPLTPNNISDVMRPLHPDDDGSRDQSAIGTLDAMGIVLRHLAAEPGKRILILLSPGFPTRGMEQRTSALVDIALRWNIRIAAVNSEGLPGIPKMLEREEAGEFMSAAAKSTGGQYLDYSNDWVGNLRAVTADPEVSYLLGFAPLRDPDGQYHALKVRIAGNRGYKVESRVGYIAIKAGETVQHRLDRVALSDEEFKTFGATLAWRREQNLIQLSIGIDAKTLHFPEVQGRRVEELTFLTVLEDARGNFIAGKQSVMDLALTTATLAEKIKKGIHVATSLPVPPPGFYRVREVIREVTQDRVSTSTAVIEVR
jgi:VWFA-related protein